MPELKDITLEFLGKTLNLPTGEATSLLFDDAGTIKTDALEALLNKDKERVNALKALNQTLFDDGYKKAQSEVLTRFEKEAVAHYGIKSDKKGLELLHEIVDAKVKANGDITPDVIKRHKIFIDETTKLQSSIDAKEKEWKDKFDGREREINRDKTFNAISQKALALVDTLKPILPKDVAKAQNQKQMLLQKLSQFEFDIQGDRVVVLKDGKVLEDEHGNRKNFEDIVRSEANLYWDFEQGENRQGAGNNNNAANNAGQNGKPLNVVTPKSPDEYMKAVNSAKSAEERIAITDAWKKSQEEVPT